MLCRRRCPFGTTTSSPLSETVRCSESRSSSAEGSSAAKHSHKPFVFEILLGRFASRNRLVAGFEFGEVLVHGFPHFYPFSLLETWSQRSSAGVRVPLPGRVAVGERVGDDTVPQLMVEVLPIGEFKDRGDARSTDDESLNRLGSDCPGFASDLALLVGVFTEELRFPLSRRPARRTPETYVRGRPTRHPSGSPLFCRSGAFPICSTSSSVTSPVAPFRVRRR